MSRKRGIFTKADLQNLLNEENSCVVLRNSAITPQLHPYYLNNFQAGIWNALDQKLKRYDARLGGVLLGYKNVKVDKNTLKFGKGNSGAVEFTVHCDCFIFQPVIGCILVGVISKISPDHIGCLVHRYFNATISRPEDEDYEDWANRQVNFGDKLTFRVKDLDFTGFIPHIEGEFIEKDDSQDTTKIKKSVKFEDDHTKKRRKKLDFNEPFLTSTQAPSNDTPEGTLHFPFLSPIPVGDQQSPIIRLEPQSKKKRKEVESSISKPDETISAFFRPDIHSSCIADHSHEEDPPKKKKKKKKKDDEDIEQPIVNSPLVTGAEDFLQFEGDDLVIKKSKKKKRSKDRENIPEISNEEAHNVFTGAFKDTYQNGKKSLDYKKESAADEKSSHNIPKTSLLKTKEKSSRSEDPRKDSQLAFTKFLVFNKPVEETKDKPICSSIDAIIESVAINSKGKAGDGERSISDDQIVDPRKTALTKKKRKESDSPLKSSSLEKTSHKSENNRKLFEETVKKTGVVERASVVSSSVDATIESVALNSRKNGDQEGSLSLNLKRGILDVQNSSFSNETPPPFHKIKTSPIGEASSKSKKVETSTKNFLADKNVLTRGKTAFSSVDAIIDSVVLDNHVADTGLSLSPSLSLQIVDGEKKSSSKKKTNSENHPSSLFDIIKKYSSGDKTSESPRKEKSSKKISKKLLNLDNSRDQSNEYGGKGNKTDNVSSIPSEDFPIETNEIPSSQGFAHKVEVPSRKSHINEIIDSVACGSLSENEVSPSKRIHFKKPGLSNDSRSNLETYNNKLKSPSKKSSIANAQADSENNSPKVKDKNIKRKRNLNEEVEGYSEKSNVKKKAEAKLSNEARGRTPKNGPLKKDVRPNDKSPDNESDYFKPSPNKNVHLKLPKNHNIINKSSKFYEEKSLFSDSSADRTPLKVEAETKISRKNNFDVDELRKKLLMEQLVKINNCSPDSSSSSTISTIASEIKNAPFADTSKKKRVKSISEPEVSKHKKKNKRDSESSATSSRGKQPSDASSPGSVKKINYHLKKIEEVLGTAGLGMDLKYLLQKAEEAGYSTSPGGTGSTSRKKKKNKDV